MKRLLISGIIVLTGIVAQAQPAAGNLFVGGNFSIYISSDKSKDNGTVTDESNDLSLTILPKAGYFLSSNIAVGAQVGISSLISKFPDNNPDKRTNTLFIIEPFGRYYLTSGNGGIFAEASLTFGAGKAKTFFDAGTEESNLMYLAVGVSPGVYYYITPKIGLEAKFGWLGFTTNTEKDGDQRDINNEFGLDISPASVSFGVIFTL